MYLRGNIYYTTVWVNGNRLYRSLRTTDPIIAKRKEQQLRDELKSDRLSILQKKWLDSITDRSYRYQSDSYKNIQTFIEWLGDIPVNDVATQDLENYRSHLKDNRNFKTNSIGIHLRALKAMFSYGVRWNIVKDNPFKRLKMPKIEKRNGFLTAEQCRNLLAVIDDDFHSLICQFMLRTGCRTGELESLRFSNITQKFIPFEGKDGTRRFPLTLELRMLLMNIRQFHTEDHVLPGWCKGRLSKTIKRYLKKIGCGHLVAHSLRHTFATNQLMKGEPIHKVSRLLGHSDIRLTMDFYNDAMPEFMDLETNYWEQDWRDNITKAKTIPGL